MLSKTHGNQFTCSLLHETKTKKFTKKKPKGKLASTRNPRDIIIIVIFIRLCNNNKTKQKVQKTTSAVQRIVILYSLFTHYIK